MKLKASASLTNKLLKDCYSLGTEESKIKRLQRFLGNKAINHGKTL